MEIVNGWGSTFVLWCALLNSLVSEESLWRIAKDVFHFYSLPASFFLFLFMSHVSFFATRIPLNQRSVVYCSGIRFGGQSEWDFAWNMMQTTNDRRERSRWVSALTCSRDASLLKRYIKALSTRKSEPPPKKKKKRNIKIRIHLR